MVGLALVASMSLGAGRPRSALRLTTVSSSDVEAEFGRLDADGLAPCPADTLPDGAVCVRLPDEDHGAEDPSDVLTQTSTHQDKSGRWSIYEQVPRRLDRPADYDAYRYPVPCDACVVSGYDLDLPDALQRRGRRLRQVGHGAVDLLQKRGTPVTMVALDRQRGDGEVLYVGPLFGTTVATRHTVREGAQLRDYVLLFGHLDGAAPGMQAGARVKDGDVIGYVGDTGSPSLVHLHLEARRVRDGVDPAKLGPNALVDGSSTVVCDPRNVLPLR
jgi:murein DD-endopeptidase MepM/ murein hydrolase activator NlpD